MAQLHPTFRGAVTFATEIDLFWNNDSHATNALVSPTGPSGNQNLNSARITGLTPGNTYSFTIVNTAPNFTAGSVGPIQETTHRLSAQSFLVQAEIGTPAQGSFDVLVPKKTFIAHYTRPDDTILEGSWHLADMLTLPNGAQPEGTAVSLIQGFLTPQQFEAIALVKPQQGNDTLVSYQFTPASGRQNPIPVTSDHGAIDQITGSSALAQTDQGTFQLFVPRAGAISIYTHTSKTVEGNWNSAGTLQLPANTRVVAISLVQTDGLGGLVVIARVRTSQGIDTLIAYQLVPGTHPTWIGPLELVTNDGPITQVTGSPAFIQSNEGSQAQFDLLVPINGVISHYTHPSGSIKGPWTFVTTLNPPNDDPQTQAIAVSLVQDDTGNLEAVARARPPQGNDFMVAYQFSSSAGWTDPSTLVDDQGNIITAGTD